MSEPASTSITDQTTTRLPKAVWTIVAVGVAIRIVVQFLKLENLHTDPDAYVGLSQSLAAGNGFSGGGSTAPTAFRPPLFPILLAVPQWLGFSTVVSIAAVQLVSSALLMVATYQLSLLMRLKQSLAIIAVCFVCCDPLLLVYSSLPMTEVPAAAFLTWAAVFVIQLWQKLSSDRFNGIITVGILAGCCFGFGGLCRPILFVACAASSILLFFSVIPQTLTSKLRHLKQEAQRYQRLAEPDQPPRGTSPSSELLTADLRFDNKIPKAPPSVAKRLMAASTPAVIAAIILCPWIIRNAVHFNHFIPATTHGGYTLLLGNNSVFYAEVVNQVKQPNWDGASLDRWNSQLAKEMEAAHVSPMDEVGRDQWMYAKAKASIAADQDSFVNACVLRIKRFWAIVPTAAVEGGRLAKGGIGLFYSIIAFGLVVAFVMNLATLLGIGKSFASSSSRQPWLLWTLVLAFAAMHIVYWTNTRMRAPLMPVLIVLSAMGYSAVVNFSTSNWLRTKKSTRRQASGEASL